ncbi:MAG: TAXI family TRAP transporter solute-binding subunit [Desulfobacteraceae bacterium]|nr:TAXI family TRAP transporter solute-binding subunit [Desulfobacteraceae bacterium]
MINKKKMFVCIGLVLILTFTITSVCSAKRRYLSIASGWVTGAYYPFAGAVSKVAWKHLKEKNIKITAESSGASVANAKLIGKGDTDFAIMQNDIAYYAHNGQLMFKKPYKKLLGCMTLYPETVQIVARKAANINSVADLKGKRVSIGPLGGGSSENAKQILAAWGLSADDLKIQQLKASQASDYMKDGRLDAYFNTVAAPSAHIIDTHILVPAHIVPVSGPNAEKLIKKYPFYAREVIPAGIYKGATHPVETVSVMAMMAVTADLEEDVVYSVLKAVYDDLDQVKKAHAKFSDMDVSKGLSGMSIPLHPGAERYYKEAGIIK